MQENTFKIGDKVLVKPKFGPRFTDIVSWCGMQLINFENYDGSGANYAPFVGVTNQRVTFLESECELISRKVPRHG